MKISHNHDNLSFGIKFYNNNGCFSDVVNYAVENNKISSLDWALNKLLHIKSRDDILIIHGKTSAGNIYSSFSLGQKTVQNNALYAKSPAEATLNAIFELTDGSNYKLQKLLGHPIKKFISPEYIIDKYSVKKEGLI